MRCFFVLFLICSAQYTQANEAFGQYLDTLFEQAEANGISAATISDARYKIKYRASVIKADKNQPERRLTLDDYLASRVPEWKVKEAIEQFSTYEALLKEIGNEYDVQPRFIVALWGNESNFGRIQGNHPVLSSLASLAFEGRREALFKRQFFAALQIVDEGHIKLDGFNGSWAGAMGQSQFMPATFLAYAVDYDKDGKKDIWNTPADVFASIANFLKQHGWQGQYTWGRQVKMSRSVDNALVGLGSDKGKSLSDWHKLGLTRFDSKPLPKVEIESWLLMPDGQAGRVYLVYENFQTLMRWNRSSYFGLSVSYLAERIKKGQ